MLPVCRQGAVVILPVSPPWPLRDLQAAEELTARKLIGEGRKGERTHKDGAFQRSRCAPPPNRGAFPPPALTLFGGGGFGEHCDRVW